MASAALAHPHLFFDSALEAPGAAAVDGMHVAPTGSVAIVVPLQSTVVMVAVSDGDTVRPGQQIAIVEAMKMEHLITAQEGGTPAEEPAFFARRVPSRVAA